MNTQSSLVKQLVARVSVTKSAAPKAAEGHSSLPGKWLTRHPNMFSVSLTTDGVPWVGGTCFAAYKSQAGLGKTPEGWPVYSQSRTRTFFPFVFQRREGRAAE